ncbi:MAG: hypothetical protein LBJ32_00045, partial [Oscillospiraceae bacterium]|nr:hypothetical protein [Oscillospiraceae bacterium]
NNFLKILAASLAVLNLFTNNFSLVNATENNISEKNSGNNMQKNINKNNLVNNPKNVKNQFSQIKNIIKRTGFGIAASLAVYSIVKKIKYIKLIKSIDSEEFPESKENLLKKFQQFLKDFKDYKATVDEKTFENFSLEEFQTVIRLCLISIRLARGFLKILSEGLNFIECSEFEVKIINTESTLVFGYGEDLFQKCDENHKTLVEALGSLAPFFSCFSITFFIVLESYISEKKLEIIPYEFRDGNFKNPDGIDMYLNAYEKNEKIKNILRYINDEEATLKFLDTTDKKFSNALKDPNTDFISLF